MNNVYEHRVQIPVRFLRKCVLGGPKRASKYVAGSLPDAASGREVNNHDKLKIINVKY